MEKVLDRLTVFFEEPFWVGVLNECQKVSYLIEDLSLIKGKGIITEGVAYLPK